MFCMRKPQEKSGFMSELLPRPRRSRDSIIFELPNAKKCSIQSIYQRWLVRAVQHETRCGLSIFMRSKRELRRGSMMPELWFPLNCIKPCLLPPIQLLIQRTEIFWRIQGICTTEHCSQHSFGHDANRQISQLNSHQSEVSIANDFDSILLMLIDPNNLENEQNEKSLENLFNAN